MAALRRVTAPGRARDGVSLYAQVLPIAEHRALFAAVGTRWGGNGVETVGLPDLRGKILLGA